MICLEKFGDSIGSLIASSGAHPGASSICKQADVIALGQSDHGAHTLSLY